MTESHAAFCFCPACAAHFEARYRALRRETRWELEVAPAEMIRPTPRRSPRPLPSRRPASLALPKRCYRNGKRKVL